MKNIDDLGPRRAHHGSDCKGKSGNDSGLN